MTSPRVWPQDEPPREHIVNALAMVVADLNAFGRIMPDTSRAIRERLERAIDLLGRTPALPQSIQEALNSGDGVYRP